MGRGTGTIDPLGDRATMTYLANDLAGQSQDANGNITTTFNYDAVNRKVTTTDALTNVTTVAYDKNGNQTTVTDPLNHTTTYAYDNANRQIAVTDANNHTTTTAYDANGNVTTVTVKGRSNPALPHSR
jgi:YD repeat-containing protein